MSFIIWYGFVFWYGLQFLSVGLSMYIILLFRIVVCVFTFFSFKYLGWVAFCECCLFGNDNQTKQSHSQHQLILR